MSLVIDRSGWVRVKFGDVVSNVNDNVKDPASEGIARVLGLDHLDSGELAITRWSSTGEDSTFTRRVRPGQTLFGKRRAYQRKTAFSDFDAICSGDILVFEPKDPSRLLPELLPFIASSDSFYARALETSAGSLSPRTKWSDIAKYEFLLPPVEEQRRIAGLLWAVERYQRSLVLERAAVHAFRDRLIDEVTSHGDTVQLGDVLTIVRGGSPRPIDDYFTEADDGLNWIKIGDVPPDGKYITGTAQKIKPAGLSKTRTVRPGDLLLSNSMSFGRPYIVKIEGCIHDGWLSLSDPAAAWRTEYLYYLLRSGSVQAQFDRAAGGSTVKNLNTTAVGAVSVGRPSLDHQDQALAKLTKVEKAASAVEDELACAKKLLEDLRQNLVDGRAG